MRYPKSPKYTTFFVGRNFNTAFICPNESINILSSFGITLPYKKQHLIHVKSTISFLNVFEFQN